MRKLMGATAVLAVIGSTAYAGGLGEPDMPKDEVIAKTSSSAGGILIPLLILILVAAAASSN